MLRYCATPPTYDLEWSPPDAHSTNRSAAFAAAAPWLPLQPHVHGGTVRVGRMATLYSGGCNPMWWWLQPYV